MNFKKSLAAVSLAIAGMIGATPALSDSVTVKVCNHLGDDGVYRPGLSVVSGGTSTYYPIGENGLTRTIVYSGGQTASWVRALLGDSALNVHYVTSCHGGEDPNPEHLPMMYRPCEGEMCYIETTFQQT